MLGLLLPGVQFWNQAGCIVVENSLSNCEWFVEQAVLGCLVMMWSS
jgi:hypothetical protein